MAIIYVRKHRRSKPHSRVKVKVREHQRRIKGQIAPLERRAQDGDHRSAHAKAVDKSILAERVLPLTERNLAKWRGAPSQIDLRGIDTPTLIKKVRAIRQKKAGAQIAHRTLKVTLQKKKTAVVERRRRFKPRPPEPVRLMARRPRVAFGWEPSASSAPAFHHFSRFQREGLLKLADARGLDRRVVDWEALIDPTLTFGENKTNIGEFLGYQKKEESARAVIEKYEGELQSHLSELRWRSQNAPTAEERLMAREELAATA